MEIKICGPGCAKCDETYSLVDDVIKESGGDVSVIKVTDFQHIAQLGVFTTPAVVVNGEVKCVGRVPKKEELQAWLSS
jgi:small redox-active disulfide protein 2